MAVGIRRPRGTADILPPETARWQRAEAVAREVCRLYGYEEIRLPTFEHTELFHRGVGDTSDIVEKETYTFVDRGGRSLTLRPEGTAGVVRAYLENGLGSRPQPVKLYYLSLSAFRYENPQAGRLREHHQFGVEALGSDDPRLDAEVIALGADFLRRAGVRETGLALNSIGCPVCRPAYREALVAYFAPLAGKLCADCQRRLQRNPLRLLDCKEDRELALAAPRALDYLCADCREHFEGVTRALAALGREFAIDPTLVRGIDYYTRTVFEFTHGALGAQASLFGGGRYDGLAEAIGGPPVPGVGFGLGMERLLQAVAAETGPGGEERAPEARLDVFVAALGAGREPAFRLLARLRELGLVADTDYLGRSLKAQLRAAGREGARFVAIVGEAEAEVGQVTLKAMDAGGAQWQVAFADAPAALRAALAGGRAEAQAGAPRDGEVEA
ncbi:MAG: histidine--tRNA ligase [Clostridia bacterium]|nr:histidine--tRNA ligase [Clostridia bacterium]